MARLSRTILALSTILMVVALTGQARQRPAPAGGGPDAGAPGTAPAPPRLVVVLVVDQMRADYVARYAHQWTRGLARLIRDGARFPRAAYPYANTVTCVGHATIATGAFPRTHGIVGNSWFDATEWKTVRCADDPSATLVSYGGQASGAYSPRLLQVSTLADELQAQLPGPGRVVSLSLKERTAIMLAGRRADAVTWVNGSVRAPVTSSFYTKAPVPFVAAFAKANPIDAELTQPWTRALAADRYLFEDDGIGEKPASFRTRTFPHALTGPASGDEEETAWDSSPLSDAYLGRLGEAAVDALSLGQRDTTDFLAISFSALDIVGHDFGPHSHEVQDMLVRLDATIGRLLDHLDNKVGRGRYVVALSADHGVASIPERAASIGLDAARLRTSLTQEAVQRALQRTLGLATARVRQQGNDLYLEPAVSDAVRANAAAADAVVRALRAVPGVAAAYHAGSLDAHAAAGDPHARAARLSWYPGRSGDFVIAHRPNWLYTSDSAASSPGGTGHGAPYAYDQQVPLVFYGAGIAPGEYLRSATPADIAPTLAFLCGVTLPRADGEVLVDALLPRVRSAR